MIIVKWIWIFIPLVLTLIMYIVISRITFNPTISEPRGYYFTYKSDNYKVGNTVLICVLGERYVHTLQQLKISLVNDACDNHLPYLLKRIVAVPGDHIKICRDGIYINDKLEKNSNALIEYKGIKLFPTKERRFKLKNDQFWVLGNTLHSYDSRYFGIVNKSQLVAKAYLIWQRNIPIW